MKLDFDDNSQSQEYLTEDVQFIDTLKKGIHRVESHYT